MGWEKKIETHWCRKPSTAGVEAGSIWKCDDCGTRWMYLNTVMTGSIDPREQYEDIWKRLK